MSGYLAFLAETARRTVATDLRILNSPPWWLFERPGLVEGYPRERELSG